MRPCLIASCSSVNEGFIITTFFFTNYLLKLVKLLTGMDFKRLISGKEGFLETIFPVLSPENVNNIVKLGVTVSTTGITISPSIIYGSLSKKVVFEVWPWLLIYKINRKGAFGKVNRLLMILMLLDMG